MTNERTLVDLYQDEETTAPVASATPEPARRAAPWRPDPDIAEGGAQSVPPGYQPRKRRSNFMQRGSIRVL